MTFGVLPHGASVPAVAQEQLGVSLALVASAEEAMNGRLSSEFRPEERRLASPALAAACRLYKAAYAAVDGYALARAHLS